MSEAYASQPTAMGLPAIHSSQFDLRHDSMPLPSLPSLASSMSTKRKRSPSLSKTTNPSKVTKKASTPNVKVASEEATSPDSDKKRNKLGYHRTSVACGHCRRRKIRCMMPDDDPSGRCSNCIRLKKECIFCPVEQSGSTKGPQTGNRAGSAPKASMRSSSPMYYGHSYEFGMPYSSGHTSYSVPPPDTTAGLNLSGVNFQPSEPSVHYSNQPYDLPSNTWETSSYATLPPISAPYESPVSISPVNQPFTRSPSVRPSPYPDSTYGSAATTNGKPPISNEIGWAPQPSAPHRTMSLQVDSYRHQSPYRQSHSPTALPGEQGRRSASIPQPPSLVMSSENSSTPSLSEPSSIGSMSAPVGNNTCWNNPWTPSLGGPNDLEGKPLPVVDSLDWFPETMNAY